MVMMIASWRKMWADYLRGIFAYVVRASIRAPQGALAGSVRSDAATGREVISTAESDATIDIAFPDILEHDIAALIQAIVSAVTLDGKTDAALFPREVQLRLLAVALGIEDVEELIQQMPEEPEPEEPDDSDPDDGLAEAVRGLRRVVEAAQA